MNSNIGLLRQTELISAMQNVMQDAAECGE